MTGQTSSAQNSTKMLLPKMQSPFQIINAPYQVPAVGTPNVFATAHLRSPWNPAMTKPMSPAINKTMSSPWMQQSAAIDIEVVPQALSEVKDTAQDTSKISWTSAEQLADALFPESAKQQTTEQMHLGLLNHKKALEEISLKTQQLQERVTKQHFGLMDHKDVLETHDIKHTDALEDMSLTTKELQKKLALQHDGLLNHVEELKKNSNATQVLAKDFDEHKHLTAVQLRAHSHRLKQRDEQRDDIKSSLSSLMADNIQTKTALQALQKQNEQLRAEHVENRQALTHHTESLSDHRRALRQHRDEMMSVKHAQNSQHAVIASMQSTHSQSSKLRDSNAATVSANAAAIASLKHDLQHIQSKINYLNTGSQAEAISALQKELHNLQEQNSQAAKLSSKDTEFMSRKMDNLDAQIQRQAGVLKNQESLLNRQDARMLDLHKTLQQRPVQEVRFEPVTSLTGPRSTIRRG